MFTLVARLIKKRLLSFSISVFALALSIASLVACLSIYQTLTNGKPIGTNYSGQEISIFTYAPAYDISFTLGPYHIQNLAKEMGTSGEIIAASGGRINQVFVNNETLSSVVDVVSDNFFKVLKVKFSYGSANEFNGEQPTCLLSDTYMKKLGVTSPPPYLVIADKSYKVIGVVKDFKGLLDSETEVWLPWEHGHNVLFPSMKDAGLLMQASLYRAIIIFHDYISGTVIDSTLNQLKSRTDLLQPPFEQFKSVRGITWSENKHNSAEQTTKLYLYISLIVFFVSVLNMSNWIALTRSSKLGDELTMLKLGIPMRQYSLYAFLMVFIPIVLAYIITVPMYWLYLMLLKHEPAISDLFLNSAEFLEAKSGLFMLLIFVLTFIVTFLISWVISRVSSVGFFSSSFMQVNKRVSIVFRTMMFLVSILLTVSLIFALFTVRYGIDALALFKTNDKPIYFYNIESNSGSRLDPQKLRAYFNTIKQENSNVSNYGLIEYAPLFNITQSENFSLTKYGDTSISMVLNSSSVSALSILDVKVKNGALYDGDNNHQIIVDEHAEKELIKLSGKSNIVGLTLYDQSSDGYQITGVVSNINFSETPLNEAIISYTSFSKNNKKGIVVVEGDIDVSILSQSVNSINRQFNLKETQIKSYNKIINSKRNPYISRLLLSISAALVGIIISALTLFSIANIDIHYRKKRLSMYSCLGLSQFELWVQANKNLLLIVLSGFAFGAYSFWLSRYNPSIQIIVANKEWLIPIVFSLLIITLIALLSVSLAFRKILFSTSLYSNLKYEE